MELLFRKYFWAINLAVLVAAAYPSAKIVNAFVEGAIYPVPDINGLANNSTRPRADVQKSSLDADALARLTGMPKPPPPMEVEAAAAKAAEVASCDPNAQPVKSALRAKLIGAMVANQPQWSLASIQDMSNNEVGVYMVGDKILGAEIIDVQRFCAGAEKLCVIVKNNGCKKEYVDEDGPEGGGAPVATIAPAGPPKLNIGQGIHEAAPNRYKVPRSEIDKTLANLNDVAMQARIVPSFKDGQANGFKVFSIRPDSIYSKIGVQNGDVISKINGYEINSPDKALEVYAKLKEAQRIEVELDRNGQTVLKTYDVE
jgi:general secretion pathway protein C